MSDAFHSSISIECELNGDDRSVTVDPSTTLLELLREEFELTGTTEGCGVGVCGCCTVFLDGEPVNACLELAAHADGATVKTIEGLGSPNDLHPVQSAFKEEEGFQCGYCTPGMVMMTTALLEDIPEPDEPTLRRYMSENLCRCTGYESVLDAIDTAIDAD